MRRFHRGGRHRAVLVAATMITVVGCAGRSDGGDASVPAAPLATDAACVRALAALPGTVLGRPRTPTDVVGAASWGEPAIVLRCGVPEPAPTTDRCLTVNGVDWVIDDGGDPLVFTAYGRSPSVQVRVPSAYPRANASAALVDVAAVASALPRTSHACIGG